MGKIIINNQVVKKPLFNKYWLLIIIFILLIFSISYLKLNINFNNWEHIINYFKTLFNINIMTINFNIIIKLLIQTITIALLATIIGSGLGLILSFYCSQLNHSFLKIICKCSSNILRSIPALVLALIIKYIYGVNNFSGLLVLSITSFLFSLKLYYEHIDTLSLNNYQAYQLAGLNQLWCFIYIIIPQLKTLIINNSFYMLESNIRLASIIGFVGAGGIGLYLQNMLLQGKSDALIIIIILIIIVYLIEIINKIFNKIYE